MIEIVLVALAVLGSLVMILAMFGHALAFVLDGIAMLVAVIHWLS